MGFRVVQLVDDEWLPIGNIFEDLSTAQKFKQATIEQTKVSEETIKVIQEQVHPQISISSDPEMLLHTLFEDQETNPDVQEQPDKATQTEDGEEQEQLKPTNPVLNALTQMGELDYRDSIVQETITKVGIIRALGVDAILECACLIEWARKLAANFTYLLECKTIYSDEIKSKYAELLTDLNMARGIADKLVRTLGKNRGFLDIHEYHEQVGTLLHYATIIRKSALQLADYHEEFMMGRAGSPIEVGEESIEYVLEGDKEKAPKRPPHKPEESET